MRKLLFSALLLGLSQLVFSQTVKFGIISDLHMDNIYDGEQRLEQFLLDAQKNEVDFVIDLGDFAMPKEQNRSFVSKWLAAPHEKYNTIGNHDLDNCSKQEFMNFVKMNDRYYSFEKGEYLFVVLDTNKERNGQNDVDTDQLIWLKEKIESSDKRIILFSHHSLDQVVNNSDIIRKILEDENKRVGTTKIVAAFCGHDHTNYCKEINGINYIQINSASYQWIGSDNPMETRYSEEINSKHPNLKFTAPYDSALYAFVTLKKNKLIIKGRSANYISPSPVEYIGGESLPNGKPYCSEIKDIKIYF